MVIMTVGSAQTKLFVSRFEKYISMVPSDTSIHSISHITQTRKDQFPMGND